MGSGLSTEIRRIIELPRAEREEDLKKVLEEEDIVTYMNEMTVLPAREPAPTAMLPEREGPSTVGLIGHIPELDWWCKRARGGPRKRRTYSQDKSCLPAAPSAREGRRPTTHWEHEEVNRLIAGVETYGQSRWSEIKEKYFPDPDPTPGAPTPRARTPGDLKDKWRNLRKTFTGDAQTRCYRPLKNKQVKRINKILGIHD